MNWEIRDESGTVLDSGSVAGSGTINADYGGLTPGNTYDWTVEVTDGSETTTTTYSFTYSNGPPSIDDNITNDPTSWQNGPFPVEIQCSDGETHCQQIDWKIFKAAGSVADTGTSTAGTDTHTEDVTVGDSNNGVLTLQYRGTDNNGLATGWTNQTIRVDTITPSSTVESPSTSAWIGSDFQADINDTDNGGSGFNSCEYQVWADSDPWWTYSWQNRPCPNGTIHPTNNITVGNTDTCDEEGQNTCNVRVRVFDNAGNTFETTFEFDIDFSPLTSSDDYTSTGWEDSATPVQLDCSNGGMSCDVEWRIRDENSNIIVRSGTVSNPPNTVNVGATWNGNLTLQYRAEDSFGSVEDPPNNQTVLVDKISPYTNVQNNSIWYSDDFTRTESGGEMTDSDSGGSGLDPTRCQYRTKDGQSGTWSAWESRDCDQVTVTVASTGANCTTAGDDACWAKTRVWDRAGNRHTSQAAAFNIDLSPPDTDNNYTDDEWKTSIQPIQITCSDDETSCQSIEWWLEEQDGTVYEGPTNASGNSVEVTVGNNTDGELYLHHRGWDTENNVEFPTEDQRIRVDTEGPTTNITGPNPDNWYNDDFTATVNDSASASGLGGIDLYFLPDSSASFFNEWDTLSDNINHIEKEIEKNTSADLNRYVWGLNQSYDGYEIDPRECATGQTLPDSFDSDPNCHRKFDIIDQNSNLNAYLNWYNNNYGTSLAPPTYNPQSLSNGESTTEGWGQGVLDILSRGTWRNGASRIIIVVGDFDTNGGSSGGDSDHESCGESQSWDLANHLKSALSANDVTGYSMLGNPECDDDPDGDGNSVAREQMNVVGDVVDYDNADELPEKIIDTVSSNFSASNCWYRVGSAGNVASKSWKNRGCPDGDINVTVNETNADCTQEGENTCIVQTKVRSGAGVNYTDIARFNIDMTPPNATCNGCDRPDPVIVEQDVLFKPNVSDRPKPENAGWDTVKICERPDCIDTYCSYTTASADESCTYETQLQDGYGTSSYCIHAEDGIGNNKTYCDPKYTFAVYPGLGDPCQTTNQCLFGSCQQGICTADDLPAPQIILQ